MKDIEDQSESRLPPYKPNFLPTDTDNWVLLVGIIGAAITICALAGMLIFRNIENKQCEEDCLPHAGSLDSENRCFCDVSKVVRP